MLFENKVAVITGAGTGIGRAAALEFAAEGARGLVMTGRRAAMLEEAAEAVRTLGVEVLVAPGDVSREADVEAMINAAVAKFGGLDAAFNNAGVEGAFGNIDTLHVEDFERTMSVNVKGVWLSMKHQIAAFRRSGRRGAIVNTSSWLACGAFPGASIYSASKAALDGMIRAVAQEVADVPVTVNNVNPGIIDTPMFRRFADSEAERPFVDHTPMRRLGAPDEVASVVVWLCSDKARFVTGQSLLVDGGYTIPGHRAWLGGDVASAGPEAGA